jgi:hypothetical protein
MPAHCGGCTSFDPRLMQPTIAGHGSANARLAAAPAAAFAPHPAAGGARVARLRHVRVSQRTDGRPAAGAPASSTRR